MSGQPNFSDLATRLAGIKQAFNDAEVLGAVIDDLEAGSPDRGGLIDRQSLSWIPRFRRCARSWSCRGTRRRSELRRKPSWRYVGLAGDARITTGWTGSPAACWRIRRREALNDVERGFLRKLRRNRGVT